MATEKRLIDANALLEKVQFRMEIDNKNAEIIAGCVNIARRLIENAPTVDAVEVVRCKDCKHYEEVCGEYTCFHPKMEGGWNSEGGESLRMNPMDFCSYGERKADD